MSTTERNRFGTFAITFDVEDVPDVARTFRAKGSLRPCWIRLEYRDHPKTGWTFSGATISGGFVKLDGTLGVQRQDSYYDTKGLPEWAQELAKANLPAVSMCQVEEATR